MLLNCMLLKVNVSKSKVMLVFKSYGCDVELHLNKRSRVLWVSKHLKLKELNK